VGEGVREGEGKGEGEEEGLREREEVGELPGTVGDLWLKGVVRADRQPIMSESSQGKSSS
jgi:hypothetical protein